MAGALTVTSVAGLELVDHRLTTQYEAMTAQIRQRLSPDHAFLFARPEPALEAEHLAWFTEGDEDGTPLSALSEESRARAQSMLHALEADLEALIAELGQGGPGQKALASLIVNALMRPSEDDVWVAGDRPVLVNWGFRKAGQQAIPRAAAVVVLDGQASRWAGIPAPPSIAAGTTTPRPSSVRLMRGPIPLRNALLWGLFVVLLGVSAHQLLLACALFGAGMPNSLRRFGPDTCPAPRTNDDLAQALATLKASIAEDERSLITKALDCQACAMPPPPASTPVVTPPPTPLPLPERTKRGKLEISLIWSGQTDLDLIVACPDGTKLTQDRLNKYNCGGEFVVDMNHAEKRSQTPIEHVIWEREEDALPGSYRIQVNPYDTNGQRAATVPFEIVISRNGQPVKRQSGTARHFSPLELIDVMTVTFPLPAEEPRATQPGGKP
ncbi:hypothetical protein [Methylobacterium sp. SI9]|uniref:hypothetical protein n=1 Tax=Methylobacterium guangdongense TaxID=3138811 RepID=UPI00313B8ABC